MRLAGKTALVTGATSGIGQAIAEEFARQGAKVVVTGRDHKRGEEVVKTIEAQGGSAVFIQADLTGHADAKHLADQAVAALGRVDILVNNAGTFSFGPTVEIDEATFDAMMTTNVKAPFFLTSAVVPGMVERGYGKVINITTAAAHTGVVGGSAYGASKAALALLTKSWAKEFASTGVNVNAISPGPIKTPGTDAMGDGFTQIVETVPTRRAGRATEIADAAVYLASSESDFVQGASLAVDGGLLA